MANALPLPPSGVPFIDPVSGQINILWQNYLLQLESVLDLNVAPKDAQYWVSTSNAELDGERNLGALSTGYLRIVTALGIAVPQSSATIPASDLATGGTFPAINGSALTSLNATQLTSGTVPDARFPATLPAVNGSALTNLNASAIASGTLNAARLPTAAVTSTASKVTAGAPYTNDGKIDVTINGVTVSLMTTA